MHYSVKLLSKGGIFMLFNSAMVEYNINGLDFMIKKANISNEVDSLSLRIAEKSGERETEMRWSFSLQSIDSHIIEIDEKRTVFYKNNLSIPEKYAFRKGILAKMLELTTPLERLSEEAKFNQTSAIFLDYSFYSGSLVLFEAPVQEMLEVSKNYLSDLNVDSHYKDSNTFPLLINNYTPIPYHSYKDLSQYRHIYLTYFDIEK